MVMEGSASAFYHSRRNREYPSFSSALLEEILRSTESCTVEDEKINRPRQDSRIGLPICMEPGRGEGGIEIGILESLKYFHGYNNNNDNHGSNQATEVDKKKKKVSALQSRRAPEAESTKRFMGREASDGLVCQQSQSNVGRHGSTRGNKDASSSSSSHGVAQPERTRTKQPMSPGKRLANFLNSLFMSMGMGKRKSKRDGHDHHDHHSEKSPVIKRNWKYKYGEKEKEKEKAAGQLKSVSVCSMSSMTASTDCTSTVSTTSSSNSSRLHHYKSVTSTSSCTSTASTTSSSNSSRLHHYKSNPCNVSKNEHAMKRYDEFSFFDHASSCHDPKLFSSSFVNNNRSPKNDNRRSVKFYPTTTVRSDEYALPCGKNLNRMEIHNKQSLPFPSKRLRPVQSIEKDMIPSEYLRYHQDLKYSKKLVQLREDENGDSDSSSDLFELQNLNAIGMDIYSRELPVYETTNLETNRAIAKGLM